MDATGSISLGLSLLVLTFVAAGVGAVYRRQLLLALPFLTALNGVPLMLGSQRIRLDQLACVFLVAGLVPALLTARRRLRFDAVTGWLILTFLINLVSSAVNSPAKLYSLTQAVVLTSVWGLYVVLINCLSTDEVIDRFLELMLLAGIIESSFGVVAFVLAEAGVPMFGALTGNALDFSVAFGAYGTLYEPNVFGSYCQAYLVLAAGMLWIAPKSLSRRRHRLVTILAGTSTGGLLLSFTRGAWLGTLVGLGALAVFAAIFLKRRLPVARIVITTLVIAVVGVSAALLPGEVGDFVRYKLSNLTSTQSDTAVYRIMTALFAWQQFLEHPVLGCGTFSFAPLAAGVAANFTRLGGAGLWISNWFVLSIHDTGIVGLSAFIALLAAGVLGGVRAARRLWTVAPAQAAVVISLSAAFIGLLVSFLFSTAFGLGYPWVFLGLLGAYARRSWGLKPKAVPRRAAVSPRPVPAGSVAVAPTP